MTRMPCLVPYFVTNQRPRTLFTDLIFAVGILFVSSLPPMPAGPSGGLLDEVGSAVAEHDSQEQGAATFEIFDMDTVYFGDGEAEQRTRFEEASGT